MPLVSKSFSDIITFSRGTNATYFDSAGVLKYAPNNLLLQSEDFSTTWTVTGATVSANATTAPSGATTADKLQEDASTGSHLVTQNITFTATSYTASLFAKKAERDWVRVLFFDGTNTFSAFFNLDTGVVGTVTGSGATAAIQNSGNGWYRCSVTATVLAGSGSFAPRVALADNNSSYTGSAGSGIYIWGAQLNIGDLQSYYPTQATAYYGPRFDYNPSTLAAQGLLIEEQRANLLTYSEAFDTTPNWVLTNSTITANATSAPDGSLSADKWIANSGATSYLILQVVSKSAVSTTYSYSLFAKQAELSVFRLYFNDAATAANRGEATFDLSSGTTSSVTRAGTFTNASANIQSVGNGWYRCSLVVTTGIETSVQCRIAPPGTVPTGDGTSGLFLWGAQVEAGAFPTSYIPTTTTALTRAADVASVNTLSPWYNASEGTIYAESTCFAPTSSFDPVAEIGTGVVAAVSVGRNLTDSRAFGAGASLNQGSGTFPQNTLVKQAVGAQENNFALSTNGSAVVTDLATSPMAAATTLFIGYKDINTILNGHIRRITYYPRRLSNAELVAITS